MQTHSGKMGTQSGVTCEGASIGSAPVLRQPKGPTPCLEKAHLASPNIPGFSLLGEACPSWQTGCLAGQANSLRGAIANTSLHSRVAHLLTWLLLYHHQGKKARVDSQSCGYGSGFWGAWVQAPSPRLWSVPAGSTKRPGPQPGLGFPVSPGVGRVSTRSGVDSRLASGRSQGRTP